MCMHMVYESKVHAHNNTNSTRRICHFEMSTLVNLCYKEVKSGQKEI